MKEKNKKEQALEIQQCVCLFTCFCCSSFVRFLIHILLFTTPHTFHFLASPFFFSLFFSLLLFFIQCPSPYPPQPHTKHAVIAIAKKKKKKNIHNHPPPCTHTPHSAHCSLSPHLSSSTNMCSLFMPSCVACSFALHMHLQEPGWCNKKQETRNKKGVEQ